MDAVQLGNKYFSGFIHLEFCCEMAFQHCFAFRQRPIKNIHKSSLQLVSEAAVLYRRPRSSITGVKCSGAPWSGRHQWKSQQMFSLQIWCVCGEIWTSRTSDHTLACCDCSHLLFVLFFVSLFFHSNFLESVAMSVVGQHCISSCADRHVTWPTLHTHPPNTKPRGGRLVFAPLPCVSTAVCSLSPATTTPASTCRLGLGGSRCFAHHSSTSLRKNYWEMLLKKWGNLCSCVGFKSKGKVK